QTLFSGIDVGGISVSMTINAPAAITLAFYVAAAEQNGDGAGRRVGPVQLSGTIQADILQEYIAQKEWWFPIDHSMRLCGDTIEAPAAVLGGTQSLHTNSYDEALALPTEKAVTVALRTQQMIAHETGVTNTVDPLGGSYFVESLTDEMERHCYDYFRKIDELGG